MPGQEEKVDPQFFSLKHLHTAYQQQLWEEILTDRCLEVADIKFRTGPGGNQQGTMMIKEPHLGPCAWKVGPATREFTSSRGISIKVTNNRYHNERMWFYPERDIITFEYDLLRNLVRTPNVVVHDFDKLHPIVMEWRDIAFLPSGRTDVQSVPALRYDAMQRLRELMPALETVNFFVPQLFSDNMGPASLAIEPEELYDTYFPCAITPLTGDILIGLASDNGSFPPAPEDRNGLFDAILQTEDERLMRELEWDDVQTRLSNLNANAARQFGAGPSAHAAAAIQFRAWSRERNTLDRRGLEHDAQNN